jgi:hypothetical protein
VSLAGSENMTGEDVKLYFDLLVKVYGENQLFEKPQRVSNSEEAGRTSR